MGDVLSQSEIDNLLNALSSGELDVDEIKENSEQTVKDYDFARPSKLKKEHLRNSQMRFQIRCCLALSTLHRYRGI